MNHKHKNKKGKIIQFGFAKGEDNSRSRNANQKKNQCALTYWKGVGQQTNDNLSRKVEARVGYSGMAIFAMVCGVILSLNSSAVATQAVMHTDDAVLSTMMDMNPEALAYVLNKMDVGE